MTKFSVKCERVIKEWFFKGNRARDGLRGHMAWAWGRIATPTPPRPAGDGGGGGGGSGGSGEGAARLRRGDIHTALFFLPFPLLDPAAAHLSGREGKSTPPPAPPHFRALSSANIDRRSLHSAPHSGGSAPCEYTSPSCFTFAANKTARRPRRSRSQSVASSCK